MKLGNGIKGDSINAPFDKIIAAAAGKSIPSAWKEQLKIGGRIVAPVKQSIYVLDKIGPSEFKERQYFGFSFVPLVVGDGD
jgi:protein-L-isoaspartate(D-aspartate) O-methyltransferase